MWDLSEDSLKIERSWKLLLQSGSQTEKIRKKSNLIIVNKKQNRIDLTTNKQYTLALTYGKMVVSNRFWLLY